MQKPNFLHPDNVDELAAIGRETGAEVLHGPLRYPSESGGWQLGDLDLSEHLAKYRDCEITLIVAATGEAKDPPIICGICGFVLAEVGPCPQCRELNAEHARRIRARHEENEALFREVERILREEDG
jgi:hypothetical protein